MTKQEMVMAIFLKRMPSDNLTDANKPGFEHKLNEAIELAEMVERRLVVLSPISAEKDDA